MSQNNCSQPCGIGLGLSQQVTPEQAHNQREASLQQWDPAGQGLSLQGNGHPMNQPQQNVGHCPCCGAKREPK